MRKELTPFQQHCERWKDGCGASICDYPGTRRVFFRGTIPCNVLFIGEAPGESENVLGSPFMGPAGRLMDIWIDNSIGEANALRQQEAEEKGETWKKITHGLANLVGCIPRGEDGTKAEAPDKASIKSCLPRLAGLVRICKPRVIILVGALAKKHVTGQAQFDPVNWLKPGEYLEFAEIVHPAFVLRQMIAQRGLVGQRATVIIQNMVKKYLK